jgi:hypothetical protein
MYSPLAPVRLSAAVFSLLFVPGVAHAHITLTDPPARHPAADLKNGPCGTGPGDSRTTDPAKITTYTAGETITIAFTESIQHNSHYRVSLSSTGDAGFVDPTGYEDRELAANDLLQSEDDPAPAPPTGEAEEHSVTVTLPSEPCEECTLQLIQVMTDKPPWGSGGGADIYYQCADIVIVAGSDTGTGGAGSGGDTGSGGAPAGSGGSGSGTGGSPMASGGSANGSGGTSLGSGGAATSSGGDPGVSSGGGLPSGGGSTVPPGEPRSCSVQPNQVGQGSGASWLTLALFSWLFAGSAMRRRRVRAQRA